MSIGDEWATFWAQHWFQDDTGNDRLKVHGMDAGWATHLDTFAALSSFVTPGAQRHQGVAHLLTAIKESGRDRIVRNAGLRLMRAPGVPDTVNAARRPVVWILSETPTPSMLEPSLAVARAFGANVQIAVLDPRALRFWRINGFSPVGLTLPTRDERVALRIAARDRNSAWDQIAQRRPQIMLTSRDVTDSALAAVRQRIWHSLPWIGPEAEAIARLLKHGRVACVVLASDQHRLGRLVVQTATAFGTPTVVLQHGLPQHRMGYLPVVADKVAVWSTASHDWFLERGASRTSLAVVGNPRWDQVRLRAAKVPTRQVLVALSPNQPGINADIVKMAMDAAQRLGVHVVVKLHPGYRDWGDVLRVVRRHPWNAKSRVQHRGDLYELLVESAITVVHRSTVAVDSLAVGRPVVVAAHPLSTETAAADLPSLTLPVADRGSELAEAIQGLMNSAGRRRYFTDRGDALESSLGPQDGRAAERIAELCFELVGATGVTPDRREV